MKLVFVNNMLVNEGHDYNWIDGEEFPKLRHTIKCMPDVMTVVDFEENTKQLYVATPAPSRWIPAEEYDRRLEEIVNLKTKLKDSLYDVGQPQS